MMTGSMVSNAAMLYALQFPQCVLTVKHADILRLNRGESSHCPRKVNKMRFSGRVHWMHAYLVRQAV